MHYKIFDNIHLKFRKREKTKIKKSHVRRPVLTSMGFLKCVVLQLFLEYSYVNLNVKKESKIQLPLKSRRVFLAFAT